MELKNIVAISGLGGLFNIIAQREDGLIVSAFGEDKKQFVSNRKYIFTPLENITIYTTGDGLELKEVFRRMKEKAGTLTPPPIKASKADIENYFSEIVPDYAHDQVYQSDMRKVMKWYAILDAQGLISAEKEIEPKKEDQTEA